METRQRAVVFNFPHEVRCLQRNEAEKTLAQLDGILWGIRHDLWFVDLVQELSTTASTGPLNVERQHIAALDEAALERIALLMEIRLRP